MEEVNGNSIVENWENESTLSQKEQLTEQAKTSRATPVRNVRISDALWKRLGKLAGERHTTITQLLIEGANVIVNESEETLEEPHLVDSSPELLHRLETLETTVQRLTVKGNPESPLTLRDESLTDTPASKMLRVSTPLIPYVQRLCELHRQGHTETITRGLGELVNATERDKATTSASNDNELVGLILSLIARVDRIESRYVTPYR